MAKKTFNLEIFRSGYAIDGRGSAQSYARQLVENSNEMRVAAKRQAPVMEGHPGLCDDTSDQSLEAFIDGDLMASENSDGEIVVSAPVTMDGEILAHFEQGLLPKRSVGIASYGMLPNGRMVGHNLDHLALLGKSPAAIQDLGEGEEYHKVTDEIYMFMSKNDNFNNAKTLFEGMDSKSSNAFRKLFRYATRLFGAEQQQKSEPKIEKNEVNMDELQKLTQEFETFKANSTAEIAKIKSEYDAKAQESAKTIAGLQVKLAEFASTAQASKAEDAFNALAKDFKIANDPETKGMFMEFCSKYGVDKAVSFYRGAQGDAKKTEIVNGAPIDYTQLSEEDKQFAETVETLKFLSVEDKKALLEYNKNKKGAA